MLYGNPLHDIPADFALAPVIETGGTRIGVAGQMLHVLARDVLLQEIRQRGDAEGVGRVEQGHPKILQPPLHHAVDVVAGHGALHRQNLMSDVRFEPINAGEHTEPGLRGRFRRACLTIW